MKKASAQVVDPASLPWSEMDTGELRQLRFLVGNWYAAVLNAKLTREAGDKDAEYGAHLAVQIAGTDILKWVSSHITAEELKWRA